MNRSERKRQAKQDEELISRGIDSETRDPEPTAAMARQLHALLERAKRHGEVDGAVEFLHTKVDETLQIIRDSRLACGKGCSHCCHAWVSVTALEALFVAKQMQKRNTAAGERVKAAFFATKDFDFVARARHPHPCPMLETELCSVYDARPNACRMAASVDAGACGRSLRLLSGETIPIPVRHLRARGVYEIAVVVALSHAGLPHHFYEFNAALTRALEHPEAEKAWLSGEDIFWDVRRDPMCWPTPQRRRYTDIRSASCPGLRFLLSGRQKRRNLLHNTPAARFLGIRVSGASRFSVGIWSLPRGEGVSTESMARASKTSHDNGTLHYPHVRFATRRRLDPRFSPSAIYSI